LVSGVSVVLSPFDIPGGKQIAGINSSLVIDLPVMLFVMAFLTLPSLIRGKLSRVQGIVLLGIYAAFCVLQFVM
jgi:cation:H+ antiporter